MTQTTKTAIDICLLSIGAAFLLGCIIVAGALPIWGFMALVGRTCT